MSHKYHPPKRDKSRPRRSLTCPDEKVDYGSKRNALNRAAKSKSEKPLTPYKCPKCNKWHLTSSETYTVDKAQEIWYMGQTLTLENGYWVCSILPNRYYPTVTKLKNAVFQHLSESEKTG